MVGNGGKQKEDDAMLMIGLLMAVLAAGASDCGCGPQWQNKHFLAAVARMLERIGGPAPSQCMQQTKDCTKTGGEATSTTF